MGSFPVFSLFNSVLHHIPAFIHALPLYLCIFTIFMGIFHTNLQILHVYRESTHQFPLLTHQFTHVHTHFTGKEALIPWITLLTIHEFQCNATARVEMLLVLHLVSIIIHHRAFKWCDFYRRRTPRQMFDIFEPAFLISLSNYREDSLLLC